MWSVRLQHLFRFRDQWVDNIYPQMKRLLDAVEEQNQMLGPNMEKIAEMPMAENMSVLSSLNTLTIDIQKAL